MIQVKQIVEKTDDLFRQTKEVLEKFTTSCINKDSFSHQSLSEHFSPPPQTVQAGESQLHFLKHNPHF